MHAQDKSRQWVQQSRTYSTWKLRAVEAAPDAAGEDAAARRSLARKSLSRSVGKSALSLMSVCRGVCPRRVGCWRRQRAGKRMDKVDDKCMEGRKERERKE